VTWKDTVNRTLSRHTGHELRRVGNSAAPVPPRPKPTGGERLLDAPGFVLSTVRSGSTLLRVILDSHSQIHAPQELHLRDLTVKTKSKYADRALDSVGLDERGLEYLLWDRLLQRELWRAGKQRLVNKTPSDVFIVDRIRECWPDAKLIFLLRHPAAIAASRHATRPQDTEQRNTEMVLRYGNALEQARTAYDGLTVRYEELASEPARVAQELCAFLDVPWEPAMLDYGKQDHGAFKPGLGDWRDKIKSGQIQAPTPPPPIEQVPEGLRPLCRAWGYLPPE
jgi:hypothetical protein